MRYYAIGTSVTFDAGANTAWIPVAVIDDTAFQGPQTVVISLSGNANYAIGTPAGATLTIADNDPAPAGPSLLAAPGNVLQGSFVSATWSGMVGPTATDWIGLYAAGASSSSILSWVYVSCLQSATVAQAAGTCPVFVPAHLLNGIYELRFLANDGFSVLATSNPISVGSSAVTVVTVSTGANAAEPATNGQFIVTRSGGSNANSLNVTYTVGGTAAPGSRYQVIGTSITIPGGANSATIPVNVVDDITYEGTQTITVTLNSNPNYLLGNPNTAMVAIDDDDTPPFGPTISVGPAAVTHGSFVNVNWSGIVAPSATDWFGLYQVDAGNNTYRDWRYVGCSGTATTGRASGICTLEIPMNAPVGNYNIRLLSNDGFVLLSTSNTIVLQ